MSELKPCPFCGGDSVTLQSLGGHTRAGCVDCGAEVTRPMGLYRNAMIEWNTRPIEDDLRKRIAELEKALNIDTDLTIAGLRKELRDATARIAELREDNATLGDSNAWLKQNYEDLERDYGVMYDKMCARIDKLKGALEDWTNNGWAEDYKARIAELEAERRWRVVADGEMPEDRATVLVAFTEYPENIDILTATYYKHYEGFGGVENYWHIEGWHSGEVTHWMPLPELPEVK